MMLKVIRSEAEHRAALDRVSALFDAEPGTPEACELEVLAVLVSDYEAKRYAIRRPTAVESFAYAVERSGADASKVERWTALDALKWALASGKSRKDLEPLIGGDGRVSEVLSGKRRLSRAMVLRLHAALAIPLEILLREPRALSKSAVRHALLVPASKIRKTTSRALRAKSREPVTVTVRISKATRESKPVSTTNTATDARGLKRG
jgi:HTH-type transcriptional regulator/antitoxin HigA